MTKLEYIDFVRNSLQMVDQTAKFHREQVAAAINNAVNTVFYEMYKANPKVMRGSLERYTTLVSSTPATNATVGRYQSTLTVDVVDLPKKAGGIIEILTSSTTTTTFVPVGTMQGEQLYGSESSLPGNIIGFSFAGGRTVEYWDMSAAEAAAGVVIRLIKQFRSYARTDNVVLPFGQDERIIELVRQYLGVIPPKDIINDNADIRNG
jgi:hypothetical protein